MILESSQVSPHVAAGTGSECIAKKSDMDKKISEMNIIREDEVEQHRQGRRHHAGSPDGDSPLGEWGEDKKSL
jgi:hypothetical protein